MIRMLKVSIVVNQTDIDYIRERADNQLEYFDINAMRNQKRYKFLKRVAIVCNVSTTMTIALAFTVPEQFKVYMGILALVLSTIVLATYQWEEFENYGAKWEKFRIVAERIRSEKLLFLKKVGQYANNSDQDNERLFIETIESVIRGTDASYFSLMVEPGKRIERRLEQYGDSK